MYFFRLFVMIFWKILLKSFCKRLWINIYWFTTRLFQRKYSKKYWSRKQYNSINSNANLFEPYLETIPIQTALIIPKQSDKSIRNKTHTQNKMTNFTRTISVPASFNAKTWDIHVACTHLHCFSLGFSFVPFQNKHLNKIRIKPASRDVSISGY